MKTKYKCSECGEKLHFSFDVSKLVCKNCYNVEDFAELKKKEDDMKWKTGRVPE